MVLAGVPHPDYDELDLHLKRISELRYGDLVTIEDGYYALVVDYMIGGPNQSKIRLAVSNGTEQEVEWHKIITVITLPGSDSHANFQEWIHQRT